MPTPNSRIKPTAYVIPNMPTRARGRKDFEYHKLETVHGRSTAATVARANQAAANMNMFGPNAIMFEASHRSSSGQITGMTLWVQNGSDPAREIYFSQVDTSFNYSDYGGENSGQYPEGGPYEITDYHDDEE